MCPSCTWVLQRESPRWLASCPPGRHSCEGPREGIQGYRYKWTEFKAGQALFGIETSPSRSEFSINGEGFHSIFCIFFPANSASTQLGRAEPSNFLSPQHGLPEALGWKSGCRGLGLPESGDRGVSSLSDTQLTLVHTQKRNPTYQTPPFLLPGIPSLRGTGLQLH